MKKLISVLLPLGLLLAGCQQAVEEVVSNDVDAPYINITQYEFTTGVDQALDFSHITGYDDVDGLLPVEVVGYINYSQEGDYYPKLTCTDTSGNTTEIAITVHVVSEYTTETDTQEEVVTETNDTCDVRGAMDENQPCSLVLYETSSQYEFLYHSENALEACEALLTEDTVCEAVYTNDHTFWGYGLREMTDEEKEASEED